MGYTWHYYDVVLFGVAASVALGVGIGWATPVPLLASIVVFSALAILIMGHGLFVNGPVDEPSDLADEVETLN